MGGHLLLFVDSRIIENILQGVMFATFGWGGALAVVAVVAVVAIEVVRDTERQHWREKIML